MTQHPQLLVDFPWVQVVEHGEALLFFLRLHLIVPLHDLLEHRLITLALSFTWGIGPHRIHHLQPCSVKLVFCISK